LWVGADSDEGTAEGLLARGAELISNMPIMAMDVTACHDFAAPADLKIHPVTDRAGMQEYVRPYAGPLGFQDDSLGSVPLPRLRASGLGGDRQGKPSLSASPVRPAV